MRATAEIIRQAMVYNLPLVLDADALFLLTQEPYKDIFKLSQDSVQQTVVLTPNSVELARLRDAISNCSSEDEKRRVEESYRGVVVVQKGHHDRVFFFSSIFSGNNDNATSLLSPNMMICEEEGGWKRSGGLGDILSGTIATFLGWIGNANSYGNERVHFSNAALSCGENIFLIPSDGFGKGLNISLYSATMESSVFAPCPAGNSPETIRLYDALELGCIPVSLKHEFIFSDQALSEFGPPPFAFLNSWDELPKFLEEMRGRLISDVDEIQDWQTKCLFWWTNFKNSFQQKVASRIDSINPR
jgi:hypothetical protein